MKPLISKRWPVTRLLNPAFVYDRHTDLKARFERERMKQAAGESNVKPITRRNP